MNASHPGEVTLQKQFGEASVVSDKAQTQTNVRKRKDNKTTRFSIRLTEAEKEYLLERAGNQALSSYCREVLLGDKVRKRRVLRKPNLAEQQYASLLAALGQSRLSSNLNQLAHHANTGTLPVSAEIAQQLQEAQQAITEMRQALFVALGIKTANDN